MRASKYWDKRWALLTFAIVFLFATPFIAVAESRREESCVPLSASIASGYLVKLQESYRKIRSLKAKFEQRSYLKSLDLSEESKGHLVLQMPGKLFWEYSEPEPQVFLLSNKEFRLYQPLDKQLLIQSIENFFLSDIPVSFLLGVGDLASDFSVEKGCRSKDQISLTLRPHRREISTRSDERALDSLLLTFSATELFPEMTEILDSEGNKTLLKILDRVDNPHVGESNFQLTPPPGTDIQDLRR